MNQFKTTSLADQVFEKLENDIIQGFYPRGEILTELKLVDQLGVSRTPIREALRRLDARERRILALRFYEGKTQMEVSAEVGISQAQVSRLEKGAINTIRKHL